MFTLLNNLFYGTASSKKTYIQLFILYFLTDHLLQYIFITL